MTLCGSTSGFKRRPAGGQKDRERNTGRHDELVMPLLTRGQPSPNHEVQDPPLSVPDRRDEDSRVGV
jgi:hypothetical protein